MERVFPSERLIFVFFFGSFALRVTLGVPFFKVVFGFLDFAFLFVVMAFVV